MRVRLRLSPGQNGTKKLLRQYGDRLVCVRYRYDAERRMRYKTAEIVVDEAPWVPREGGRTTPRRYRPGDLVYVRIGWNEHELRTAEKAAGAIWRPKHKLWELDYGAVQVLGLAGRIVGEG